MENTDPQVRCATADWESMTLRLSILFLALAPLACTAGIDDDELASSESEIVVTPGGPPLVAVTTDWKGVYKMHWTELQTNCNQDLLSGVGVMDKMSVGTSDGHLEARFSSSACHGDSAQSPAWIGKSGMLRVGETYPAECQKEAVDVIKPFQLQHVSAGLVSAKVTAYQFHDTGTCRSVYQVIGQRVK